MSQPPKRRPPQQPPPRKSVPTRRPSNDAEYDDDYAPPRRSSNAGPQRGAPYSQQRARYAQPKRDMFPVIMGGLVGAMIVGIGLIIILLLNNNTTTTPGTGPVASATPPRLSMDDFKKLYDNPATRPMIIDVRAAESYNEGHIAGALSMPEANIDTLVSQIPKNSLVVAYCQWPAENESARVAQKLHDQYDYSFDNLKVLEGGWGTWNDRHNADPNGYPTATGGSVPANPDPNKIVVTPAP